MRLVRFDQAQPHHIIVYIGFDGCSDQGGNVECHLGKHTADGYWFCIKSKNLPNRYVCLKDQQAIKTFVNRHGFINASDCVNTQSGHFGIVTHLNGFTFHETQNVIDSILPHFQQAIPQRTQGSGLCWYCALCFAISFPKELRNLVLSYSTDAVLNSYLSTCLSDKSDAEQMRHHLYYTYGMGDDPQQPEYMDGKSGCNEFIILCAQLGIPFVELFAPDLTEIRRTVKTQFNTTVQHQRPHLHDTKSSCVFIRCLRTRFVPPLRLSISDRDGNTITYKLVSGLLGSEYCKHQLSFAAVNGDISALASSDADAQRHNIYPIFWKVSQAPKEPQDQYFDRWWSVLNKMIPITNAQHKICDFSPLNRAKCTLEKGSCDDAQPGLLNPDYIYIREV